MQQCFQPGEGHPETHLEGAFVEGERCRVKVGAGVVFGTSEPDQSSRCNIEVSGEVFSAHADVGLDYRAGTEDGGGGS